MAQKDIEEAVSIIQKAVEKAVEKAAVGQSEKENELKDLFLEALSHKVNQIHKVKVVSYDSSRNFINFCCEIPKIDPNDTEIAHRVIKTIDIINLKFFFKKETNLRLFNFCSKYFLFSQYSPEKKVNVLNFSWGKNKFEMNKICFCFMCKFHFELAEEKEFENDDQ